MILLLLKGIGIVVASVIFLAFAYILLALAVSLLTFCFYFVKACLKEFIKWVQDCQKFADKLTATGADPAHITVMLEWKTDKGSYCGILVK